MGPLRQCWGCSREHSPRSGPTPCLGRRSRARNAGLGLGPRKSPEWRGHNRRKLKLLIYFFACRGYFSVCLVFFHGISFNTCWTVVYNMKISTRKLYKYNSMRYCIYRYINYFFSSRGVCSEYFSV
jgi:hypothetical protein